MRRRDTSALSESEPKLQLELCLKPEPERAPFNGAKLIAHFLEMSTKHINTQRHIQQLPTMHITQNTQTHILGINVFFICAVGSANRICQHKL